MRLPHLERHYVVSGLAAMKDVLCMWNRVQPKAFFCDGIRKLVDCYKNFVELPGDGLKNNVTIMYMSLFLWLVKGYCLYILIDLCILFCGTHTHSIFGVNCMVDMLSTKHGIPVCLVGRRIYKQPEIKI
jgi:hypothetical protein